MTNHPFPVPFPDQQTKESSKIMSTWKQMSKTCLVGPHWITFSEIVYLIIWVVASKQANKTFGNQDSGGFGKLAVILWQNHSFRYSRVYFSTIYFCTTFHAKKYCKCSPKIRSLPTILRFHKVRLKLQVNPKILMSGWNKSIFLSHHISVQNRRHLSIL